MAEQHRATADEWASVKALASGGVAYSTILELRDRIEALEAKDDDDKEAWAAMRKAGISAALRIKALKRRIDALEATQRAINQPSNRIHLGLGDTSEITSAPASGLSAAVNQAASEAFRADRWIAWPDEVAATEAKPNHPEIPDSSLVERVAAAIHPNVCADPNLYLHEARAAIRAVAAWMREHYGGLTATTGLLEQEAKR